MQQWSMIQCNTVVTEKYKTAHAEAKGQEANGDVDMNLNTFLNSEPDGTERLGNSFSGNLGKEFPVPTE